MFFMAYQPAEESYYQRGKYNYADYRYYQIGYEFWKELSHIYLPSPT